MSAAFLDKVVLLSSAVADADNHVMMHGRKLELLLSIEELLPKVPKAEITSAQKKVEDLCLRTLFQNCPFILIRPIVSVLSLLYSRGSSAAMHACVAFLFQLAGHAKEESKLDRPIPGTSEEDEVRQISVHEKSACLSVAVGIIVAKGPSASYFVPSVVATVEKHMKLRDPAARESAVRNLGSVIEVIGVPGSAMGSEIFKRILYKGVYVDKSPQVKLASAYALAVFCSKCRATVAAHADTIWAVCLRIIASLDHGLSGSLLTENRNAHCELLVQLLLSLIEAAAGKSGGAPTSLKGVSSFSHALSFLLGVTARKYRAAAFAVEALTTSAIRLFVACGEKEEDLLSFCETVLWEISSLSVSVSTRMINRLLRSAKNESGVLRIVSEVLMPILRLPAPGTVVPAPSEETYCVALAALVESVSIVESSISALDSDLSSDLIQLITSSSSVRIATNSAFALRALCRVCPSQAFPLVNVLLNHLTIQHAEMQSSVSPPCGFLQAKQIMHCSLALASVMCECAGNLPLDVTGAIMSTAAALIDVGEEDMASSPELELVMWRKKYCGFVLLVPILTSSSLTMLSGKLVTLLTLWKNVLGKRTREAISKQISPGTVIPDLTAVVEPLQTVLLALTCLRQFLSRSIFTDADSKKLIVIFLNNTWQLVQAAVPLEQSSAETCDDTVSTVLHAIRAELYRCFLGLDAAQLDSTLAKPLIVYLTAEILKEEDRGGMMDCALLFEKIIFSNSSSGVTNTKSTSTWFGSFVCDAADPGICESHFLLSNSVLQSVRVLDSAPIPVKDYYASALSGGSLEHYFSVFPTSEGSPFCPLVPYASHINSLCPLAAQMSHPVFEAKLFAILLLAKLLSETDKASFDACANVLVSSYTSLEMVEKPQQVPLAVAAVAATAACTFRLKARQGYEGVSALLSLFASCDGLGAPHPFVRRISAVAIAAIFTVHPNVHDSVFQLITDTSVSSSARTRAATALLIAFLIDFDPKSVSTFAPNLFRLARELALPIRSCALFAIFTACRATQSAMAPWARDVAKIATAHAVADIFPSVTTSVLISAILCAFVPVANLSRQIEGRKCALLWSELKNLHACENQQLCLARAAQRFCISFASRSNSASSSYVVEQIEKSSDCFACCRAAIVGLTELTEQGLEVDSSISSLFDSLLVVSETTPALRKEANHLLKAILRVQGSSALQFILNALLQVSPEEEENEENGDDDYGSDGEETRDKRKEGKNYRKISLTTKALLLKCLKRIFKGLSFSKTEVREKLDQIINLSVSAIAGESSADLAVQGAKLLCLIISIYGEEIQKNPMSPSSGAPGMPLLLQFETQIMSALRRGVRTNSDSPSLVQKLCLSALKKMVEKNLTSSVDKCIELLVQPLVLIDPATMPWSSFFVLREAGNSVMSGRSPLTQTSEKEISLILFSRMQALVDLGSLTHKHALFIDYFLHRMLMDCAVALAHRPGRKYGSNLFSFLESDIEALLPELRQNLTACVINGLAPVSSCLVPPADCPFGSLVDMKALYVGVCMSLALQIEKAENLCALAKPAALVAAEFPAIMDIFRLNLDRAPEAFPALLDLGKDIREAERPDEEIVWNLTLLGIGTKPDFSGRDEIVGDIGESVVWLSSRGFFKNAERAQELMKNVLLSLAPNHAVSVVKIVRETLVNTSDIPSNLVLMDAIDQLFVESSDLEKNYVILLLIPVFARLVGLLTDSSAFEETLLVPCLERMRESLIIRSESNPSVVIQCVQKLLTVQPVVPSVILTHMLIPTVTELLCINLKNSLHLLHPLVTLVSAEQRDSAFWRSLLRFILKISYLPATDNEVVGKCIVACMQPVEIFRESLSLLSQEEKTNVESLVRTYIPKNQTPESEPEAKATVSQPSLSAAPQIQLKLKFGAPKV